MDHCNGLCMIMYSHRRVLLCPVTHLMGGGLVSAVGGDMYCFWGGGEGVGGMCAVEL